MAKITKEQKTHDLALLFVKREMKGRLTDRQPWQKELELMMEDYAKAVEFMDVAWSKHGKD